MWQTTTIASILTNEKYKGDALLQKRFTVDFLQKKMKDNEGEVPLDFDENVWGLFVDHATVSADRTITFFLKTGKQMTEEV